VLSVSVLEVHVTQLCGMNSVITIKFMWWPGNFPPHLQRTQISSAEIHLCLNVCTDMTSMKRTLQNEMARTGINYLRSKSFLFQKYWELV